MDRWTPDAKWWQKLTLPLARWAKNTQSKYISFNLNVNIIKIEDEVKLLGVTIDYELKFNSHNTNICRKASRQLNVLKWMGKYLNRLGKLTVRVITVFTVFRLLTDFVCLYTWLSLCEIARSSVILLLPLFTHLFSQNLTTAQ